MTDIFLKLDEQLRSGFPFAVYCKPGNMQATGIFQTGSQTFQPDFDGRGFVFAPFSNGKACYIPAHASDIISVPVDEQGFEPSEGFPPETNENTQKGFEALVAKSVAAIKGGSFDKLVVSRRETVQPENVDIVAIFKKMLQAYPMAFRYCFYHPDSGLWMGATPEQLLKVENRTLHTVALAGTQLYRGGGTVVWQEKEKQEQRFVTDYITASLQDFTIDIRTTEPYTFKAGNIVHIKTDISAELKSDTSLDKIIAALHPTPAVCGLPKDQAHRFLLQNEGYDREFYSGYLGEINMDIATGQTKTDLFVNLRCMKIEEGNAHLYIGCGITKDSDPTNEFLETVNKSMTMRRVL